jgi:hypothetical protein
MTRLLSRLGSWFGADIESSQSEYAVPSRRHRLYAAVLVGTVAGLFAGLMAGRPEATPDFLYPYTAAQLFLEGQNPYQVMKGEPGAPEPYDEPFFYPFTAVLPVLPFAALPVTIATGLFIGISSALLAFLITRDGLWRLHIFASAPFVVAATVGQFSPLVMAMAFSPALGFLATLKPNLGMVLFVRRPGVWIIVGSALALLISVAVFPNWPAGWLESLTRDLAERHHKTPVTAAGGFLLLLSAIAWKKREGRTLLALSLVPQALFFYDQLLLWLIPRTRSQSVFLTAASQLAMLLWYLSIDHGDLVVASSYPFVMGLVFMPALGLVLFQHFRDRASTAGLAMRPGEPLSP